LPFGYIFVDPDLLDDSFESDAVVPSEGNNSHAVLFLLELVSDRHQHRLKPFVEGINDHFLSDRQLIVLDKGPVAQFVDDWNDHSRLMPVDF
jgi:hypothetical protein